MSVPEHALRCGPETSVTSPLRTLRSFIRSLSLKYDRVAGALGMWESRRDFQEEWEGWKAGISAFHAFHSSAFPTLAWQPVSRKNFVSDEKRVYQDQFFGSTHNLLDERIGLKATVEPKVTYPDRRLFG